MSFNALAAERLNQLSRMMELLGMDSFKASAHARAARAIVDHPADLGAIAKGAEGKKGLMEIEGVGQRIADKIIQLATTGTITEYEELKGQVPPGLLPILDIQGIGPKTVAMFWKEGGVTDLAGLKRIIADGSIVNLPRMGEKAAGKIKEAIELAEQGTIRLHLGVAMPIAERIVERMKKVKGVKQVAYAGSLRRGRETVGDIDILISTTDSAGANKAFIEMREVRKVLASGDTRSSVRFAVNATLGRWEIEGQAGKEILEPMVQVDLRVIAAASWGAALMYFTGSKDHNVQMREWAQTRGLTLNEYGLFPDDEPDNAKPPQQRGVKPVAAKTEEEIYAAFGLAWVPPELRENRGEFAAFALADAKVSRAEGAQVAKAGKAKVQRGRGGEGERGRKKGAGAGERANVAAPPPVLAALEPPPPRGRIDLVEIADIKAELHAHTRASDGAFTIERLVEECAKRGFHTIAITDHSKSSIIAGGLSPERLREHIKAVHAVRAKFPKLAILAGSEVDILGDGRLDYDDELLAELDHVVASPHAGLSQDSAAATARLIRAIEHPAVRVLGHPTGRMINRRAGLSPDMNAVCEAAKANSVALEINCHWMRLDMRDVHVRAAVEAGCLIAIDCDVHHEEDFENLRYGVMTARRGWVSKDACVNTWDADRLRRWIQKPAADGRG